MPTQALYNLAQQAGISVSKAEEYWDKAKKLAAEEHKADDYAYITGITKKMMGVTEQRNQLVEYVCRKVELVESQDNTAPEKWNKPYLAKVKSTLMEYDVVNQNGRRYSTAIAKKIRESARLKQKLEMRALVAQGNHPKEGLETDINKIGGVVTQWEFTPDDKQMSGMIEILNTSTGRDIYELLKANIPVGVSARGYGDVDHQGNVIEESYELLTFDLVIDPSFENAITKVQEIMERYRHGNLPIKETRSIIENNKEDLVTMFENTEVKKIVMEDAFFDLNESVLKKDSFESFLQYAKSYINEVAQKYFASESAYSVDYSKFWGIVENIISSPAIYELPVLFESNTVKTLDKESIVCFMNKYCAKALEEYNKIVRKTKGTLNENYLFRYLDVVAKTSHLIESTDVMKNLDKTNEEESMADEKLKKGLPEAEGEEEFVLADFEDEVDEAPVEEEPSEECEVEEPEELGEATETPEDGDYRFYDEDELPEAEAVDGMDVEKLDSVNKADPLVDDAEAPKPGKAKPVEGAESTTPKETEGSAKADAEHITVSANEVRALVAKYKHTGLTMKEAATVLLSAQIIEKKLNKKAVPKKKVLKKKVKEVRKVTESRTPIQQKKVTPVQIKRVVRPENISAKNENKTTPEGEGSVKLCEMFNRGARKN